MYYQEKKIAATVMLNLVICGQNCIVVKGVVSGSATFVLRKIPNGNANDANRYIFFTESDMFLLYRDFGGFISALDML